MEDPQHTRVRDREERKHDKALARAEAYEETMRKTIAAVLRDPANKKSLARDGIRANQDERGMDRLMRKSQFGAYEKCNDEEEIITGREPRPWERD